MKEITLKEWSAYLPYGLKGELQFDKSEDFELQDWAIDLSKFKKGAIWKLCGYADTDLHIPLGEGEFNGWIWRNEYTYVNFYSGIKPILYDLSWLTREITHEGETFIPIVELAKIGTREEKCYIINSNNCQCYVDAECQKKGFFIYRPNGFFIWQVGKNGDPLTVWNQLQLFTKLFEWKFNVFSLPDELIVRVTEDFNPYK